MFNKRVIYTAHNPLPHHKDGLYYKTVFKIIYRLSDYIIVHTAYIKRQIVIGLGIDSQKVFKAEHGLYDVSVTPGINLNSSKEYFQIASQEPVLLFFGKIVHYKGMDVLLKSMLVEENYTKFQILIAGRVSAAYQDEFNRLISDYPFNNVTILNRYLSDREVEMCFKASALTILPYREASQSGVMLMSFSYGVPVVVPDLGSFPEYVNDGNTGLVFRANDWKSLAKVLVEFSERPDQFQKEKILKIARSKYSWDDACEKISRVYSN
jgi:glycosyltransferase involved in cell wall biosynthesis